jgi:glycosyltransferase involved in cell wall biosynthesis
MSPSCDVAHIADAIARTACGELERFPMSAAVQSSNQAEPFLSIVTVSLNAAATIEDTIASVAMQQTSLVVEHICVDGGSSDATRLIIDRWSQRFRQIRSIYERDDGIYDAMNKGLRAARGEYVLFLNADDFLVALNTLDRVMQGLSPGSPLNPDLIVGDACMGIPGRFGLWRHRRVPRVLGRLRGCGLFPVHQGQFTKRVLLDAVGGFDPKLGLSSDVIQYYNLERKFLRSIRVIRFDVSFMRAGGASNEGIPTMFWATLEFYKHLRRTYSRSRAALIAIVKTLQSAAEIRWGACPHHRWFASTTDTPPASATES